MIVNTNPEASETRPAVLLSSGAEFPARVLSSKMTLEGVLVSDGRITVAGTLEGVIAVTMLQSGQPVSMSSRFHATISGTLEGDEIAISGSGRFRAQVNCTSIHLNDKA